MYASPADIANRYRNDVTVTLATEETVLEALHDASDEIDTYLATRYGLPLAAVPGALVRVCCDIAVYRIATDAGAMTEEKRVRYEDAVKWLTGASQGKPDLSALVKAAADGTGEDDGDGLPDEGTGVEFAYSERLFTRSALGGCL